MSECCGGKKNVLLFACSGGSNVGQIASDAAKAVDQRGHGRMFCAVGVVAGWPSFVETAKKADARIAIDGCAVQCVKKGFDAAGIPLEGHVVVTELGIKKGHHFDYTQDDVAKVADAVVQCVPSTSDDTQSPQGAK